MRYVLALSAAFLLPVAAHADGDADAGQKVFAKCAICHSNKPGENKIGPSLAGIVGRPAHSEPGFTYSDAMSHHDVTWTADELNTYLQDPRKVVPGTKMIFPGLKDDKQRADLIAYLSTLKQ